MGCAGSRVADKPQASAPQEEIKSQIHPALDDAAVEMLPYTLSPKMNQYSNLNPTPQTLNPKPQIHAALDDAAVEMFQRFDDFRNRLAQ